MLRRWMVAFRNAPMAWMAFSASLLVFSMTRLLPGADWSHPAGAQEVVDHAFVEALRGDLRNHQVLEGLPQTFGAHVLSRYAVAVVAAATGDASRAGVWLSLCAIVATLGGVYTLCRSIFPLRGFAFITLLGTGGLGTLHYALSPDPSTALGMALMMWGVVCFVSALEKDIPERAFLSALFIGLAAYIRLELALLWVILALYLIALSLYDSAPRAKGLPLLAMAFGGLLMIGVMLWPLIDRNLALTGSTAILPGIDAEIIFGAPEGLGHAPRFSVFARVLHGFKILMFDPLGAGVFAGLLWPVGIGVSTVINRHRSEPFLWLPLVVGMVILLAVFSLITGLGSYEESMRILTPLLFPFAALGPVYVLFRWLQSKPHSLTASRGAWMLTALVLYGVVQFPHAFRRKTVVVSVEQEQAHSLQDSFSALSPEDRQARLLTDRPGDFLAAGKSHVHGLRGETDWEIHTVKYANGAIRPEEMIKYMRKRDIGLLHLAEVDNPLVDELENQKDAPDFNLLAGIRPPHRIYQVIWPEPL